MGVALILGVNTAIVGFIIYVLFIASNDNPIRKLAVISVPNHVCRVGRRVVGDSVADSTWNFVGYVLYRVSAWDIGVRVKGVELKEKIQ